MIGELDIKKNIKMNFQINVLKLIHGKTFKFDDNP